MNPTCATCRYFVHVETTPSTTDCGICRRYPAQWTSDVRGWEFPGMKEIGWCGEYALKITLQ